MRNIQHILMSGILVLSAGSVMAAPETKDAAAPGFYALSQVTDSRDPTKMALTDTQLDTITGGWSAPDGLVRSLETSLRIGRNESFGFERGSLGTKSPGIEGTDIGSGGLAAY